MPFAIVHFLQVKLALFKTIKIIVNFTYFNSADTVKIREIYYDFGQILVFCSYLYAKLFNNGVTFLKNILIHLSKFP